MARSASKSKTKSTSRSGSRAVAVRRGLGTGGGRALGTPNKVSAQAKDNIVEVFQRLGGVTEMTKWARKNKDTFYTKLYARLIPKDVSHSADAGLEELLTQVAQRRSGDAPEIADGEYIEIAGHEADSHA